MKLVFSAQEGAIEKMLDEIEQTDRCRQARRGARMLPSWR